MTLHWNSNDFQSLYAVHLTSYIQEMKSQSYLQFLSFLSLVSRKNKYWASRAMYPMQSVLLHRPEKIGPSFKQDTKCEYCENETVLYANLTLSQCLNVSVCLKWHLKTDIHHNAFGQPVKVDFHVLRYWKTAEEPEMNKCVPVPVLQRQSSLWIYKHFDSGYFIALEIRNWCTHLMIWLEPFKSSSVIVYIGRWVSCMWCSRAISCIEVPLSQASFTLYTK